MKTVKFTEHKYKRAMKRIVSKEMNIAVALLLSLAFCFLPGKVSADDSVAGVMKSYRSCSGVHYVNVNSFLLRVASLISGDDDAREILGCLDRVSVVYAEDASEDLKREIMDSVNIELENGYEIMTEVKDSADDLTVWCRLINERISEMVVVSDSESSVIYLKSRGKGMPVSEIAQFVSGGSDIVKL